MMRIGYFFRGLLKLFFVFLVGAILAGVSSFATLKILTARQQVTLPDLRGLTLEEAIARLEQLNLRARVRKPGVYSDVIPPQHVAEQAPPPGEAVKPGRTIEIALSLGSEKVIVPDLTGDGLRSVRVKLRKLNLIPEPILQVQITSLPEGVIYQSPPPGDSIKQGERVRVIINRKQDLAYVMPDVVGRREADVIAFFRRRGYRIGQILYEPYAGLPPGIVIRQTPAAGHPLYPHDVIILVVSRIP